LVTILAIESSCDETAASVCINGKIVSNIVATQTIHQQYGGVVPELASRAHMQNIVPVVAAAMQQAGVTFTQLTAVGFTQAPGLIGSLLVGAQFAKSISLSLQIPLLGVHHMQAHVLANLISGHHENNSIITPNFPFLCLTVSGGHTQLVVAKSPLVLEVIGETIDDAAGEAFDKTAKILGLPYPGGPLIDQYAALGNPQAYQFAKPQVAGLDFSFSGLKTSVLYFLQAQRQQNPSFAEENRNDLCASVQATIIDILLKKLIRAVEQTGIKQVCIAGGVSANSGLRAALQALGDKRGWKVFIPKFEYCTDNAAMIAITAYHQYLANQTIGLEAGPSARASW
jgi:N6-L-threonylcarbamoyladenine synthase